MCENNGGPRAILNHVEQNFEGQNEGSKVWRDWQ